MLVAFITLSALCGIRWVVSWSYCDKIGSGRAGKCTSVRPCIVAVAPDKLVIVDDPGMGDGTPSEVGPAQYRPPRNHSTTGTEGETRQRV
jgi:hypothetical protein